MSQSVLQQCEGLWMAAMSHPFGIGVIVTEPGRAKPTLYAARKSLKARGVQGLDAYTVRTSPENPAFELYIIRDPTYVAPTTSEE